MEKQEIDLSHIVATQDHIFPTIKESNFKEHIPDHKDNKVETARGKHDDFRKRKLRLEYQQLMRKVEIQKKIDEKQLKVSQRRTELKQQQMQKILKQKQTNHEEEEQLQAKIQFQKTKNKTKHKWVQTKTESSNCFHKQGERMVGTKQNTIKVYVKNSYNSKSVNVLPSITKNKTVQKSILQHSKGEEVNLIEFGIFSQHKNMQNFLHKLKHTLQKQFLSPIDLQSQQDGSKLQFIILKQIHQQGKWIE